MMTKFLNGLEKSINAYLRLDPLSEKRLAKLTDTVITIELLPISFIFQLTASSDGIKLYSGELLPANCKISGTPLQMLNVAINKSDRHTFFANDLKIEGDASISQQVIELFDEINIDWEEYLSQKLGDSRAHHIARTFVTLKNFIAETKERFCDDINEYLHEESDLFPPKEALTDFYHDIDQLRMDIDRLEARLRQLKNKAEHK